MNGASSSNLGSSAGLPAWPFLLRLAPKEGGWGEPHGSGASPILSPPLA